MATAKLTQAVRSTTAPRGGLRVLAVAKPSKAVVVPKVKSDETQMQIFKAAALSTVAGNMMMAGHAEAAQQVAQLAASDNRAGVLLTLFLPVIGWVGFNILGPLQNQLADMDSKRSIAIGTGLGLAALLAAGDANAAQQVAEMAGDNRIGVLLTLFLPVIGWVGFNILGPLQNQLADMDSKKGVAIGAGLGLAALLAAGDANAAQQVAEIAGDNRTGVLLTLFLPVIGWVAFNILGPAKNQLDNMKKSAVIGTGLGLAGLLAAEHAEATQQVAEIAGDNRTGVLLTLFLPVLGWVAFNILGPAKNQIDNMKKSAVVGTGLGLAGLLAAEHAEAAQQVAEIAGDNRTGVLLTLFLPVVGWVAFNILGPLQNQLDNMKK